MRKAALIAIITINAFRSYSEYDFNANCRQAYNDVLSLKIKRAQRALDIEKSANPGNDIPYLIENYIDFIILSISEEPEIYSRLRDGKSKRVERLEGGDRSSAYYNYCLAEVHIQWAFIHARFREYIAAASELNRAYRLLQKNEKKFRGSIPDRKCLGVLHVLISAVPEEYRWVTDLLKLYGDLREGTEEIEQVYAASRENGEFSWLRKESLFYLTFIYTNFWNDRDRLKTLDRQIEDKDTEESPLMLYAKVKIAMVRGNNDRAAELLQKYNLKDEQEDFHYLDYLRGLTKLNRLDRDADKYFIRYIKEHKGKNYAGSALQKLAWFSLVNGEDGKYREYITEIKKIKNAVTDEDRLAMKEAESGAVPNPYLLKARLLCDGGYYSKSIQALIERNATEAFKSKKEYLEFTYRLGRAYHGWEKYDEAIPYYEMTIRNGSEDKYYFAANSSLQMGMIYEQQKNYKKAEYYYRRSLWMKNDEYRNSIRQKAKAGLRRVGLSVVSKTEN
jgi:hypothetical protein